MTQLRNILIALSLSACLLPGETCAVVEADKIIMADLGRLVPAFQLLDPDIVVGYTPAPGLERVFTAAHLRRLMRQHGITDGELRRVCFARLTEPLTEERLLPALGAALGRADADLEVLEFSQQPVPTGGVLHFKLSRLRLPLDATPETPLLWRGSVEYGERRSMPIWVRIRARVRRQEIVALRDLPVREPIREQDVEERTVEALPDADWERTSAGQVVGGLPRRTIRAGQIVSPSLVNQPNDVERGDVVLVEVSSGAARLRFEAKAEVSGRRGDRVQVLNPNSGKRFAAIVSGPGKVEVQHAGTRGQT